MFHVNSVRCRKKCYKTSSTRGCTVVLPGRSARGLLWSTVSDCWSAGDDLKNSSWVIGHMKCYKIVQLAVLNTCCEVVPLEDSYGEL